MRAQFDRERNFWFLGIFDVETGHVLIIFEKRAQISIMMNFFIKSMWHSNRHEVGDLNDGPNPILVTFFICSKNDFSWHIWYQRSNVISEKSMEKVF